MKKLIAISALLCILISSAFGMSAFAQNKTYYDMDFDDISFAIDVETEEKEIVLNTLTGWTLSTISGEAVVETVNATDVNASWTGRGKVLKVQGTDASLETTNAALKITLPVGYTYDSDKFYLEYDLFVPEEGIKGSVSIFANDGWNTTSTYLSSGVRYLCQNQYTTRAVKTDMTPIVRSGRIFGNGPMGSWQRYTFVLDGADFNKSFSMPTEYGGTDNRTVTGIPTLKITIKDLATGTSRQEAYAGVAASIYGGSLTIGGDPSSGAASALKGGFYIDNLKIYSVDKFAFVESADDEATGVLIDNEYVEFKMNAPILESSLSTIEVTGGGDVLSTSAELVDEKTVRVNILEDMAYDTVYTVNFGSITNAASSPIETAKKTISFTTEPVPPLYINEVKAFKGVGAYSMAVDTFAADSAIYTAEAQVENTVDESKDAYVVYAIYDANGRLKDTAVVSQKIDADKIEKMGAGITIPAECAGGTVRVLLWDSITFMQPYSKPIVFNIAQ